MKHIEVRAEEVKQHRWTLYTFVLDSAIFDRIAFVSRREQSKDEGYQRNLSHQRATEIAHYIDKDDGCIPNSILVNLEKGATYISAKRLLRIPDIPRSAWVIDGQHRMYGLRLAKRHCDLVITAFVGLDISTQAKQFKIINSKQKGVPTSLLYDLLDLTKDGTFLQQRGHDLAVHLNEDPESPWLDKIDMTGSGGGLITQTRVVSALVPLISERGALFQYSEEEQYGVLRNYFTAVRTLLPADWGNKEAVLTKAIGFSALLALLPQVLTLSLQRSHNFIVDSVIQVLRPIQDYDFSVDKHKGWAGHPGENRLAGALAGVIRTASSPSGGGHQKLRLS